MSRSRFLSALCRLLLFYGFGMNAALRLHQHSREDCDAEIPAYDLADWSKEHPDGTLPDHPAIFTGYKVAEEAYTSLDNFLGKYGDDVLTFFPDYGQPGGFGAQFVNHNVKNQPLREAAKEWNNTHTYSSYFNCQESTLCQKIFPRLDTPQLFQGAASSINFLVGGPGSGLPLHEHGKTWQGLHAGRKAWYLIPPGAMTEELAETTSPFLVPVRAWSKLVDAMPLGKRPLRCVQHPGEIMYFPDRWFHGTENLDAFQLAWGAKPENRGQQQQSTALTQITTHFPNATVEQCDFALDMRFAWFKRDCKTDQDHAIAQLEEPLQRLKTKAALPDVSSTALSDTLAFAYCAIAAKTDEMTEEECPMSSRADLVATWRKSASEVSPNVAETECVSK